MAWDSLWGRTFLTSNRDKNLWSKAEIKVKLDNSRKFGYLVFRYFGLKLLKIHLWMRDWGRACVHTHIFRFCNISYLRSKWDNSHVKLIKLDIKSHFTSGKSNLHQNTIYVPNIMASNVDDKFVAFRYRTFW